MKPEKKRTQSRPTFEKKRSEPFFLSSIAPIAYLRCVDIRTKLVFTLVAVALASMLAFGLVTYGAVKDTVWKSTSEQLNSLADGRKELIQNVVSGWQERVRLIASRTQLRESLRRQNEPPSSANEAAIARILNDAASSVQTVATLAAYDLKGDLVAQAGKSADSAFTDLSDRSLSEWSAASSSPGDVRFQGTSFSEDGMPRVGFLSDLSIDGQRVGTLYVLLRASALLEVVASRTGLGQTGEILIVQKDRDGGASTLHAVRHRPDEPAGPVKLSGANHPGLRALAEEEGLFTQGLIDYRGQPVWAATRYLEATGWGLVVKFDEAEVSAVIARFREQMTSLGLSLAAFAILIGVVLAFRFANPIHDLAETANRLREGELRARVKVIRTDEIGLLARTFNDMADELEERMTLLREFKKFFDLSLDLLCIAGTDGYFKMTNPAFEEVLGWSRQELLAEPFLALVHPEDTQTTWDEIEKLSKGIPTISFVNRFRCMNGSYKYLSWTAHPDPETCMLYSVARVTSRPPEA